MKNFFALVILILATILLTSSHTFAQSATEERLKQVEARIATEGSKTATQSSKTKSHKAISFIEASVVASSGSVLTISADKNIKTIYTTDSTKFINIDSSEKKLIGFGDIKVNDTILVVGVPQGSSVGTAKLIIRDQNKIVRAFSMIGRVSELKDNLLALAHFSRTDLPNQNINLTNDTAIVTNKSKPLNRTSIIPKAQAIVSGAIDDKGTFLSKQIFLINLTTPKNTR